MATIDQHVHSHSWDNTLKGFVLGAVVGSLVGLSASLGMLLVSGNSLSLALATLAVFTVMVASVAGFIGMMLDLEQREQTHNG